MLLCWFSGQRGTAAWGDGRSASIRGGGGGMNRAAAINEEKESGSQI